MNRRRPAGPVGEGGDGAARAAASDQVEDLPGAGGVRARHLQRPGEDDEELVLRLGRQRQEFPLGRRRERGVALAQHHRQIARMQLNELSERIVEKGIKVTFEDSFIDSAFDSELEMRGARAIRSHLIRKAEDLLSCEILSGACGEGAEATILAENGEAKIKIKTKNC